MTVTIKTLQEYLFDHYGGRANEQGMFMKLVEEIGETAEVLNMRAGRKAADDTDLQQLLSNELADIIHYTVAIAAINGIDLTEAIVEKDRKASVKYHHKTNLAAFIQGKGDAQ